MEITNFIAFQNSSFVGIWDLVVKRLAKARSVFVNLTSADY
jgi:hypothetical protein